MSTERDLLRDYGRQAASCSYRDLISRSIVDDRIFIGYRKDLTPSTFEVVERVLDVLDRADEMDVKRVDVSGLRDAIRKGLT